MNRKTCAALCVVAIAAMTVAMIMEMTVAHGSLWAQTQEPGGAIVRGDVRDSGGRPLTNATVTLQLATEAQPPSVPAAITHTDSAGAYRFASLPAGAYTLRAEMSGYDPAIVRRVALARKEMRTIDLTLVLVKPLVKSPAKSSDTPAFFDEPEFTVAGVTQAANPGGHGSDTVFRTTEALVKATSSLNSDPEKNAGVAQRSSAAATESSLREAVANNPDDSRLHRQLGDAEENLGHPLEAVREYQRAAELDPSEPNLFDWGTELLAHRALEPAAEVFAKGNRSFPKSARMLVALGVALYARGADDQAARDLVMASDLAPDDPTPYLFLGKMQSVQAAPLEGAVEALARFAQLHPDNAWANYYYASGLWKREVGTLPASAANLAPANGRQTPEDPASIEKLLLKAVQLDPTLAAAYLQLGILYSQRGDFAQAIAEYRRAIEVSAIDTEQELRGPNFEEARAEAHYRLAQAYSRTGEKSKAQAELQLHADLIRKTKEKEEREQQEIQEFVISLRGQNSGSQ
jgi:tetratricopeptide (TPR) repeat protein